MLGIGDAIAVASVCAVLIGAILRFIPNRGPNGKYVRDDVCLEKHRGLERSLDELRDTVEDLRKDIKQLMQLRGIGT